jgi:cell wall-associated NlpC family hydrolase
VRVLTLFLLLSLLLPCVAHSLDKQDLDCLIERAEIHKERGRKYIWGDWDCSKFFYQICRECSISMRRCRARDYADGMCGFDSKDIPFVETKKGDIPFWDFNKDGIMDHIGIQADSDTAYHNSTGRKRVVKDDYIGVLVDALKKMRRFK